MIIDITGTVLIPGNNGENCPGNGRHFPNPLCCDECDYLKCCLDGFNNDLCTKCNDKNCPHSGKTK